MTYSRDWVLRELRALWCREPALRVGAAASRLSVDRHTLWRAAAEAGTSLCEIRREALLNAIGLARLGGKPLSRKELAVLLGFSGSDALWHAVSRSAMHCGPGKPGSAEGGTEGPRPVSGLSRPWAPRMATRQRGRWCDRARGLAGVVAGPAGRGVLAGRFRLRRVNRRGAPAAHGGTAGRDRAGPRWRGCLLASAYA